MGPGGADINTPSPSHRRYGAFAYNPDLEGCVLHGGSMDESGAVGYGDTWLFRDRTWRALPHSFNTDNRDDHGLAYHRTAKKMLMLEGVGGQRGILAMSDKGWEPVRTEPLHPRHQCSPLVWADDLGGLVLYGGEECHRGPQFDTTMVLRLSERKPA